MRSSRPAIVSRFNTFLREPDAHRHHMTQQPRVPRLAVELASEPTSAARQALAARPEMGEAVGASGTREAWQTLRGRCESLVYKARRGRGTKKELAPT